SMPPTGSIIFPMRAPDWIKRVAAAVVTGHQTPREIAAAIAVGVFLGCTPFFGFQTILAAPAAYLFRLNVFDVGLGTQISNPFFAGFLTITSVAVGGALLHNRSNILAHFSVDWLVGSAIVGVCLGAAAGAATYAAAARIQSRRAR